MIELRPYSDLDAWSVFRFLDGNDFAEAEAVRGSAASNIGLFADWRQVEGARLTSSVVAGKRPSGYEPFAVVAMCHSGQAGVAQAAMLAKDHRKWRRELVELGSLMRRRLVPICEEFGVHRIEARCWNRHPTASRFLEFIGFQFETDMPGFGGSGQVVFQQYAFLPTKIKEVQTNVFN
ncbi:MAG: hypothetical protein AAFX07_00595 [Pseudomonadota bacterium]